MSHSGEETDITEDVALLELGHRPGLLAFTFLTDDVNHSRPDQVQPRRQFAFAEQGLTRVDDSAGRDLDEALEVGDADLGQNGAAAERFNIFSLAYQRPCGAQIIGDYVHKLPPG